MVKRFTNFIGKEISSLHQAAYVLAFFTLFAQIIAFFRGRLLAGEFGASLELDIYFAAFRIPDMMFIIMSAIVSVGILVPYIIKVGERNNKEAKDLISSVFTLFLIGSGLILILLIIFMPSILGIVFPKFISSEFGPELVTMSRIMCFSPFVLGISSFVGSIIQTKRKFMVYALAPVLYNLGTLTGILYLYPKFGLIGLSLGVIVGSLLHLGILLPSFLKTDLVPSIKLNFYSKDLRDLLKDSVPRMITGMSGQINFSIIIAIAGLMSAGAVSIFSLSNTLQGVTISLIGASYALAAFPAMSNAFSKGNVDKMLDHFVTAARHIIFWTVPISVLFIVLRAQVVRTVFGTGNFSWDDTRLVAASLAVFSISMLPQALNMLFIKGFYSANKTWKPLIISLISTALVPIFAGIYFYIFKNSIINLGILDAVIRNTDTNSSDVLILPLALVSSIIFSTIFLYILFTKEIGDIIPRVKKILFQTSLSSVIMGIVTYKMLGVFEFLTVTDTALGVFLQGLFAGLVGITTWIIALVVIDNREIKSVWRTIHSKIWRVKPIIETKQTME